jgi:hypothetical protein
MKVSRLAAALAVVLIPAGPAFALNTTEIKANGASVLPSLGVTIDVVGDSALPTATRSSHAVELGYIAGRGRHKQELEAGDRPIVFGGQTFSAPQDVRYTANIRFADLVYRHRRFFGESNFAIEGLAGIGWASLGLKAVGATQSAADNLSDAGLVVGVGGLWRFRPATSLQVRLTAFGSGSTEGVTGASRFEVYVVHALARSVNVRAGLGTLSAHSAREDDRDSNSTNSPIRASASGVLLGLDFVF